MLVNVFKNRTLFNQLYIRHIESFIQHFFQSFKKKYKIMNHYPTQQYALNDSLESIGILKKVNCICFKHTIPPFGLVLSMYNNIVLKKLPYYQVKPGTDY